MPTYLWSGKDRYGNRIVQRLTTQTVGQSKELLLERGYTDLVLHTSDTQIAMREANPLQIELTPEEELTMRSKGGFYWMEAVTRTFKEHPILSLFLLAFLALEIYRARLWTSILCAAALVGLYSTRIWFSRPLYYFRKLNEARQWHRWDDVLHLVQRLKTMTQ